MANMAERKPVRQFEIIYSPNHVGEMLDNGKEGLREVKAFWEERTGKQPMIKKQPDGSLKITFRNFPLRMTKPLD
jgi:hypothetical protein